jgi:hypothetical protein
MVHFLAAVAVCNQESEVAERAGLAVVIVVIPRPIASPFDIAAHRLDQVLSSAGIYRIDDIQFRVADDGHCHLFGIRYRAVEVALDETKKSPFDPGFSFPFCEHGVDFDGIRLPVFILWLYWYSMMSHKSPLY